jgi:tripartite-type tricarboxylate transporter receptor subunit TctC
VPLIKSGQLRALAVTAPQRIPELPDIPTMDELGYRGMPPDSWQAIVAPAGTPPDIIAKLNGAVRDALADPSVQQRLRNVGQEIWPVAEQTPQALAAKQKAEIAQWTPIIKAAGIKQE